VTQGLNSLLDQLEGEITKELTLKELMHQQRGVATVDSEVSRRFGLWLKRRMQHRRPANCSQNGRKPAIGTRKAGTSLLASQLLVDG